MPGTELALQLHLVRASAQLSEANVPIPRKGEEASERKLPRAHERGPKLGFWESTPACLSQSEDWARRGSQGRSQSLTYNFYKLQSSEINVCSLTNLAAKPT